MFRLFAALTMLLALVGGSAAVAQTGTTIADDTSSTVAEEDSATTVVEESTTSLLEVGDNASIKIHDLDLSRYGSDGLVTMTVAFQGLSDDVDPTQVVVTENDRVVEDLEVTAGEFQTIPAFVALVIDTSGSMELDGRLDAAKAAAVSFVEQKATEDFVALVTFADSAQVVTDFTSNGATVIEAINALEAANDTAMFDGIVTATDLFASAPDRVRKNMIVLTDGADEGSTATVDEAIAAVQREDVRTFGVAIQSGDFEPVDLEQISIAGGGLFLPTNDPEQLSALYGQIQRELSRAVVIRFLGSESNPADVEFAVRYGPISAVETASVPGFVTTTSFFRDTTTSTLFELAAAEPQVVTYDLPLPTSTIMLLATLGIGGAVALFLFILLGNEGDGASRFSKRLAAYGRRGGLAEEKRPILERIPLLNRFTAAAEEQVRKRGLLGAVNATLEQGNLPLSAGEAIAAAFGLSAVIGLIAGVVTLNPIIGFVAFGLAVLLVFGVINFIGGREKRRFENQLPDT
ncbi:MAG: VWA domain-containing protein, partial [Acidimicrobiia bacterium]|nr:VWA domain-containing protein [Acidimicrobiia bacterium]